MGHDLLKHLNPEQRQSAECKEHCLVVAAPGSGKTGMLASKAAYLLSDGVTRVAAVTFTRDSAMELRHRILNLAGESALPRLLVGTFHSIDLLMAFPNKRKSPMGAEILKEMRSPFTKDWVLVSNGNRLNHIIRAMKEAGMAADAEPREASKLIETFKASGITPESDAEVRLLRSYREIMDRHGEIDFQDILLLTNRALKNGSMTPLPVDHLLLDEFQDTDQTQLDWAMAHGVRSKITAVGDDDQSIYGFRSALGYRGMESFASHFNAERIVLGTNYRCRSEVLSSAGLVIVENKGRVDKRLFSFKGTGGMVLWDRFAKSEDEADACAVFGGAALLEKSTFAVIARTNRKLDEVEVRMVKRDIPFRRADGESIMDSPEFALFNSVMICLTGPTDKAIDSLLAWAGVSETDLREIHHVFGHEIKARKLDEFKGASISTEGKRIWREFSKYAAEWQASSLNKNFMMMNIAINSWLSGFTDDKRSIKKFGIISAMFVPKAGQTLIEKIKEIEKIRRNKDKKEDAEAGKAKCFLVTAHGSKGLEFDRVWIIGAEEEAFPDLSGSIEEERRLFYVAMTRARETLIVSASGKRLQSRFIDESKIPRADVDYFKPAPSPAASCPQV